jgi:hypothetical protein
MFGIMQHLSIVLCGSPQEAIDKGYSALDKYENAKLVTVKDVVVVKHGTTGGNRTVDFFMEDEEGNKYMFMVTGNLLKSIPC